MKDQTAYAQADNNTEINNMLCCLEFLAEEAENSQLIKVHAILRRSIKEIGMAKDSQHKVDLPVEFADILCAFKFFARFCIIEDPSARQEIVRLIETLDKEALKSYAL